MKQLKLTQLAASLVLILAIPTLSSGGPRATLLQSSPNGNGDLIAVEGNSAYFSEDSTGNSASFDKVQTLITTICNMREKQFNSEVSTVILKGKTYKVINLARCSSFKNGHWVLSRAQTKELRKWAEGLSPEVAARYDKSVAIQPFGGSNDISAPGGVRRPLTFSDLAAWTDDTVELTITQPNVAALGPEGSTRPPMV